MDILSAFVREIRPKKIKEAIIEEAKYWRSVSASVRKLRLLNMCSARYDCPGLETSLFSYDRLIGLFGRIGGIVQELVAKKQVYA
jgi:hypothetical protein